MYFVLFFFIPYGKKSNAKCNIFRMKRSTRIVVSCRTVIVKPEMAVGILSCSVVFSWSTTTETVVTETWAIGVQRAEKHTVVWVAPVRYASPFPTRVASSLLLTASAIVASSVVEILPLPAKYGIIGGESCRVSRLWWVSSDNGICYTKQRKAYDQIMKVC